MTHVKKMYYFKPVTTEDGSGTDTGGTSVSTRVRDAKFKGWGVADRRKSRPHYAGVV